MEDRPYKVTLQGAGLTLEREVTKHVGDQIAVLILTGADPGAEAPAGIGSGALNTKGGAGRGHAAAAKASIREFLNFSEPKRSPDRITAIGVYLQDHEAKDTFSRADIEKGFEAAAESVPANLPRDISWAVRAGWIAPKSGSDGSFYVTNSGREAVTKRFPNELLKRTRIEPQNRKVARKSTATP